ncbi:MAG: InlB B-repeat-containing protein, partial [bacterium]
EFSERQVVLMAHSMGGLVARHAMNTNENFRDKVHKLITMGSPHLGSPLANPTWIYWDTLENALNPTPSLKDYQEIIHAVQFSGAEGDFDLAWYNPNDVPTAAKSTPLIFSYHSLYQASLLDNSISDPFLGSTDMNLSIADSKIIAYGGYTSTKINGNGQSWPDTVSEEVSTYGMGDHTGLFLAKGILYSMKKNDGTIVNVNDGFVPLASALINSGHNNNEKINLTADFSEKVDHASYLDVPSTMDYISDRLKTMVTVNLEPKIGGRWRIDKGAWQKNNVRLPALKPGSHTIDFKSLPEWTTPASQIITIKKAEVLKIDAIYTKQLGSIKVNIYPIEAKEAGARWRITNQTNWLDGGSEVQNIATGDNFEIEFNNIDNWSKPDDLFINLSLGENKIVNVSYTNGSPIVPIIGNIDTQIILEGSSYLSPIPSILNGTFPIMWSLIEPPSDISINSSTGQVSWVNPTSKNSPYTITIKAENSAGNDTESWQLTVTEASESPVINAISNTSTTAGTSYTCPMPSLSKGTVPITWTLDSGPFGMTINTNTGVVSWSNPTVAGSPHTIAIRATNTVGSDTESWLLDVSDGVLGDVNADGVVDLKDANLATQVLVGLSPARINLGADVNGDGWIGLTEAIYALQIKSPNYYTVNYNANNATSGSIPASQTKTHDVALTLQTNTGNLARAGYTFDGWNTNTSGTGTTYSAGANYTTNASDVLYAKWTLTAGTPLTYTDDLSSFGANWYNPEGATITKTPPEVLALPVFSGDEQIYGVIPLGDSGDHEFNFAVDLFGIQENLQKVKVYFDRNNNKDLTDDGEPIQIQALQSSKISTFNILYSTGEIRPYSFKMYDYFADWDQEYHVAYYRDCGWMGEVEIIQGQVSVPILILDNNADGIYNSEGVDYVCIDLNGNGSPEAHHQSEELIRNFDPFFIFNEAYAVNTVAKDGTDVSFRSIPLGTLSGVVTTTSTGEGLPETKVEAWASVSKEIYAGPEGYYAADLPEGTWTLRASNLGYIPEIVEGKNIIAEQTVIWNIALEPIPVPCDGSVILNFGNSYDFAKGEKGSYTGGDFYLGSDGLQFYANNYYQRGVLDLGDIGETPLTEVIPHDDGYYRFGVNVIQGHTYLSLAREGEEGGYIIFKVISIQTDSVTIEFNFLIK